jgi:hypothetical protein
MQSNRLIVCGLFLTAGIGSLPLKAALTPDEGSGLFVTGTVQEQYNDNLFLRTNNAVSDYVTTLTPGLEFDFGNTAQTQGTIIYQEAFSLYDKETAQNSSLANLTANVNYNNDRTKGSINASYVELASNGVGLRNSNELIRRDLTDVGAKGELALTEKTSLGVGGDFSRTFYKVPGSANTAVYALPVDVYSKMAPDVDASLDLRFRETDFSTNIPNYQDIFIGVGSRGQFTEKFSGQFSIGASRRHWNGGENQWLPGGSANFTYIVSPKTTIQLGASDDFNSSIIGSSQKILSGWVGATTNFEYGFSANARFTYENVNYRTGGRENDWQGTLGVHYQVNKHVSFQVAYSYEKDNTNSGSDYTQNIVSVSGTLKF